MVHSGMAMQELVELEELGNSAKTPWTMHAICLSKT
jgi:hypothetical protein